MRVSRILLVSVCLLCFSFSFNSSLNAQCDADMHAKSCISQLKEGYTFLKNYKIDGQDGSKSKVEYSYVFSKDANYLINVCSGNDVNNDGIVISIYDAGRRKVASNSAGDKLYPAIGYACKATGIYYITFTFEGTTDHCGGAALGFQR